MSDDAYTKLNVAFEKVVGELAAARLETERLRGDIERCQHMNSVVLSDAAIAERALLVAQRGTDKARADLAAAVAALAERDAEIERLRERWTATRYTRSAASSTTPTETE